MKNNITLDDAIDTQNIAVLNVFTRLNYLEKCYFDKDKFNDAFDHFKNAYQHVSFNEYNLDQTELMHILKKIFFTCASYKDIVLYQEVYCYFFGKCNLLSIKNLLLKDVVELGLEKHKNYLLHL